MLEKLGYDATTATNGREAADMVSAALSSRTGATPFAAVLMDVNMPVMDGFAATELILSTHQDNAPPLIALTASVLQEDRQLCINAGMVGFLAKPLRIDALRQALARYAPESIVAPELIAASAYSDSAKSIKSIKSIKNISGLKNSVTEAMLFDASRLDRFKDFDDAQRTLTREVVALFMADAPQRVRDIQRALALNDAGELSRAVHSLKGAAGNVGAVALANACDSLERACLQGLLPENAAASVAQLALLADRSLEALRQWEAAHALLGDLPHPAA